MRLLFGSPLRSTFVSALSVLLLALCPPPCLAGAERCIVCGMDTSRYPHTHYEVETQDGKTFPTCGAQCGLTLHLRFGEKWKRSVATDLLSNRSFDAAKGFYVYNSTVITDMAPGFIAFSSKKHADGFAKGFGGQVLNYRDSLDLWKEQMGR